MYTYEHTGAGMLIFFISERNRIFMQSTLKTNMNYLKNFDADIAALMEKEYDRQWENIELIASENIASPAVIAAMGSVLTNKYAEGYPGHRYYGGCVHVDGVEQIAIDRAKALFGAEYANVQPHSGAQANLAVYSALLHPGDLLIGMDLQNGGHLTHGAKVNLSGKVYRSISYGGGKFALISADFRSDGKFAYHLNIIDAQGNTLF